MKFPIWYRMIKFTILSIINILQGIVGVLTLGFYIPNWDVEYLFYMLKFDFKFVDEETGANEEDTNE